MKQGLLAGKELLELIEQGVIDAKPENVNAASIDVRLGEELQIEDNPVFAMRGVQGQIGRQINLVDLDSKEAPLMRAIKMDEHGYAIRPNQFLLAHTVETFNLPDNISALFVLRSSIARAGLEHMQAGWADAGFNGAQLTLEFKNMTEFHELLIKPGMRIGQMIFWRHEDAGDLSYAKLGNYNGQQGATTAFALQNGDNRQ